MLIRRPDDIRSSDITPERDYLNRRRFIAAAGIGAAALVAGCRDDAGGRTVEEHNGALAVPGQDEVNSYEDITTYNNFYEFGTDKGDPAEHAHRMRTRPWTIQVTGKVKKPGNWTYEDLIKPHRILDRTYRLRCVEAWSMVIPWQGIPLRDILARFQPEASAKFVVFTTLLRPAEMPGQRRALLDWPYVEGLRLDEAMHPLTLMATGLYGKPLPNQNGAPIRLVVPWKYGFKSIKSIVKIELTDRQPATSWNVAIPEEYGFYANVNPKVDHPRWTQASERRIGKWRRIETLMFNGYADQVASMYAGMDLRRFY